MKMPGFTAEAAFHAKSRTCYRGVYRSGSSACSGVVTARNKIADWGKRYIGSFCVRDSGSKRGRVVDIYEQDGLMSLEVTNVSC